MKTVGAALVLLLFLALPVPGAQAQSVELLDDGTGDLEGSVNGQAVDPPAGRFEATDLTGLSVEETKEEFVFRLTVANLAPDNEIPFFEGTTYSIDFLNGKKSFRVSIQRSVFDQPQYNGQLQGYDAGRDDYFTLAPAEVTTDAGENMIVIEVARKDLTDQNGAQPFPEQPFTGFLVTSISQQIFGQQDDDDGFGPVQFEELRVTDSMPDDGPSDVELAVKYGVTQSGHARLRAEIPYRSSNGEATTFVYEVEAENLHPGDVRFDLGLEGVPANWDVRLPAPSIKIEANGTVRFPVIASMPFGHNHGSAENFVVTLRSRDDPNTVGRVELGVRYVDPPQPAGHHDMLYLHSRNFVSDEVGTALCPLFRCGQAYMNTLPEDDFDQGVEVPASTWFGGGNGFGETRATYYWEVPLSPGLELGLDFDLGREGTITIPLHAVIPVTDGTVEAQLVHFEPDDSQFGGQIPGAFRDGRTVVAKAEAAESVAISADSDYQYEAVVRGTRAGDYVPFELGASLSLEVFLNMTYVQTFNGIGEGATNPRLLTGGEMQLPLLEYHDPFNLTFSSLGDLDIAADGEQERMVNPGETVLFNFTLANTGLIDDTLHLNITGEHNDWARIVGDAHIQLLSGEDRRLVVAVTPPDDATDGDVADLVVNVQSVRDPNARALSQLRATVNTTADFADEAYLLADLDKELSSKKGAPGVPTSFFLAALGLVVVALRRRGS